jgi:hypothetical protein
LDSRDIRIVDSMRLLEETGDLERCLETYPDLSQELRAHADALSGLSALAPPAPPSQSQNVGRRVLLSSLSAPPASVPLLQRLITNRAAALTAAATLFALGAVGAGAATGSPFTAPINDVLENVGIGGDHGEDVSEKVHDAIENTAPGPERGKAVSEAACEAAHNRETLPEGAQNAPGQEGKDAKECGEDEEVEEPESDEPAEPLEEDDNGNHGQNVSEKVHDAIENTDPGPERGHAVSEAACEAAHDRTTLPQGAQNAPGKQNKPDKPEKDCTHPNSGGE